MSNKGPLHTESPKDFLPWYIYQDNSRILLSPATKQILAEQALRIETAEARAKSESKVDAALMRFELGDPHA